MVGRRPGADARRVPAADRRHCIADADHPRAINNARCVAGACGQLVARGFRPLSYGRVDGDPAARRAGPGGGWPRRPCRAIPTVGGSIRPAVGQLDRRAKHEDEPGRIHRDPIGRRRSACGRRVWSGHAPDRDLGDIRSAVKPMARCRPASRRPGQSRRGRIDGWASAGSRGTVDKRSHGRRRSLRSGHTSLVPSPANAIAEGEP